MSGSQQLILGVGAGGAAAPTYIEDVFSTWLYTGNGSTQTITNGINVSGSGGLVWGKDRNATNGHYLTDTARGTNSQIRTQSTAAETTATTALTAFNTNGFSVGSNAYYNQSSTTYASWTFRKQPKFFDIVTYTGNGTARTIAHNLGSVPGCIIIKRTDATSPWSTYHRSQGTSVTGNLQDSVQGFNPPGMWNSTTPTSTVFSIGTSSDVNANGGTYVAYLFAHDAGGFGLTGTDNVITCSQFTLSSSTGTQDISLGYEPQWIMFGPAAFNGEQMGIYDSMRGMSLAFATRVLRPSASTAEDLFGPAVWPNATGFTVNRSSFPTGTYVFIAIRRGPMKTPTSGTSVYSPNTFTTNDVKQTTSFPVDMLMGGARVGGSNWAATVSRLQGLNTTTTSGSTYPRLITSSTSAELSGTNIYYGYDNTGFISGGLTGSTDNIAWSFRRAPGFFDVVCYTGTGVNRTVTHNLGVAPELMIVKRRSSSGNWSVYAAPIGAGNSLTLNLNSESQATGGGFWNSTAPTASVFTVGVGTTNTSFETYVAYLFASCPGVSKVGSYTGTGATLQIDCGFTGGARFVLIKRTDSTGDWYVWDSARGIVSGNDPYLLLNSTAAEVTNTDWVDTHSPGFELSNAAGNLVNVNGGTYIFLAIA